MTLVADMGLVEETDNTIDNLLTATKHDLSQRRDWLKMLVSMLFVFKDS